MKKRLLLVLLAVSLIFISACAKERDIQINEDDESKAEVQEPLPSTSNNGLGTLCYGKEECISFCLKNRGRCEDYCKGNLYNELCKIVFPPESKTSGNERNEPNEPKPACVSDTKPIFTIPFTDLSKIYHITPIGNIKAGSQSRSYIFVKRLGDGSKMLAPLYAPTNATLFGLVYAYRGDKSKGARAEYRLDFRVSCEVTFAFDHISQISDRLRQFAPSVPAENTRRDTEINVPVIEGELLGYTDGGLAGGAWDFILFNYQKEVFHINPARWTSEHNKYADCPYDYFTEDLKKQYYSLFASAGGEKSQNPTCRSASRDVEGTLSGGWFKDSATDSEGSRLLVGSDFSTVDLVIDEGNPLATGSVLSIRHQNAPIKPEDVKVGESVCYSDGTNHAFLKLLTEMQMGADIGPGSCPGSLSSNHDIWER